jgi:hypothetical protein
MVVLLPYSSQKGANSLIVPALRLQFDDIFAVDIGSVAWLCRA